RFRGSVRVRYGAAGGTWTSNGQILRESDRPGLPPPAGDLFGTGLAIGNVVGSVAGDIAVGSPVSEVGPHLGVGAVYVYKGSTDGIVGSSSRRFTAAPKGVPLDRSAGSQFGWDLAIGNFGRGSALDLAIDAPGQTIGDGGGAVFVLFHSATRITGIGSVALTRQTPGVPGDPSELGWGAR